MERRTSSLSALLNPEPEPRRTDPDIPPSSPGPSRDDRDAVFTDSPQQMHQSPPASATGSRPQPSPQTELELVEGNSPSHHGQKRRRPSSFEDLKAQPPLTRRTISSSVSHRDPRPSTSATMPEAGPSRLFPQVDDLEQPGAPIITLEDSFFAGPGPIDDFVSYLADWIAKVVEPHIRQAWANGEYSTEQGVVEVEAKLGRLIDNRTKLRFWMPVMTETILAADTPEIRFEASMAGEDHHHFNWMLNKRCEESAGTAPPGHGHRFSRKTENDEFYPSLRGRASKLRVTRDAETGNVTEVLEKTRLADLNVFSPRYDFDWRLSINIEKSVPMPAGVPNYSRAKDRLSYEHQLFKIDLTMVKSSDHGSPSYELEIEIAETEIFLTELQKHVSHAEDNCYLPMIQALLNNVRMLARNSRRFKPQSLPPST